MYIQKKNLTTQISYNMRFQIKLCCECFFFVFVVVKVFNMPIPIDIDVYSYDKSKHHIKKQTSLCQTSYGFSSSHIQI